MRFGPRHFTTPENILINNNAIQWVREIKYLGLTIVAGAHLKVNLQHRKHKFFQAVNAILGSIGTFSNPHVVITLMESHCVPILLYGLECIETSKSVLRSLENAYSQIYIKIFKSLDKNVIRNCQYYMGQLTGELKVTNRKLNFLTRVCSDKRQYCYLLDMKRSELKSLVLEYKIAVNIDNILFHDNLMTKVNWRYHLIKLFEESLV